MPCRSCGGNKKTAVNVPLRTLPKKENSILNDSDMILITYENQNRGKHKVVGAATHINYGYRQGGGIDRFYVHKDDIATYPQWFVPYNPPEVVMEHTPINAPEAPRPIVVTAANEETGTTEIVDFIETKPANEVDTLKQNVNKPLDLQSVPGVTPVVADELFKKGVRTWEDIIELGVDGLKIFEGVGEKRANAILNYAKKHVE